MNFIVKNEGKGNPLTIYRGIVIAIVMMFLIPPLFNFGYDVSTNLTDAVIKISDISADSESQSTISKALISSMIYDNETKKEHKEELVNNWKTIDINETEGGFVGIGDVYKYSANFFMLIILSLVTIFLFFFVAIQIAKRVMELALYKIIGPFCCTSFTTGQPKAFDAWSKSVLGCFLITVVQFVSMGLLMNMFGSAWQDTDALTGLFLTIGALLFVISTPTLISSLLDQRSGVMSAFGDIQSALAISAVPRAMMGAGAGALARGSAVVGKKVMGGVSNMFHKGGFKSSSSHDKETKEKVKENMNNQNHWKATNINEKGKKYDNVFKNNNPYQDPFNVKYNPLRNQYMNNDSANTENIFNRDWY